MNQTSTPRIAILGAGAAGLCMAIQLRAVGIDSFTIYERSDGVGGTWRDNTYPGAACDVPSHLYSFSFSPKTDWSRKFAEQPEILDYFESLVDTHDLGGHLRFGVEILSAAWDDERAEWTLRTADEEITADVVVSGLGQLNRPNTPDIDGLDRFEGTTFHSARWDHSQDLRGERVAVIGVGASAIQFVPRIATQARHLTLFQRSVNYVAPKPDREFRAWEHWLLDRVPAVRRAYRASIFWRLDMRFPIMRQGSRLGRLLRSRFAKELAPLASERLPDTTLIPDYNPGCRRILIANDWYPTLLRPDVRVVTDPVTEITPHGVRTESGQEHPVDTIIFGTGFHSTEFLSPLAITGRDGIALSDVWSDGAHAYLGVAVSGFPNLFMLYGPNTNLGHNSILFMIEQQVRWIRSLLVDMIAEGFDSAEVTPRAMDRDEADTDRALARTVWAEECHSWYKNASGRVTNNWPDFAFRYRNRMRHRNDADLRLEHRAPANR